MSGKWLFVFEGQYPEKYIVKSLQNHFLQENSIVTCVYGAEIYQLYKAVSSDPDLDLFNLLKERNYDKSGVLNAHTRNDFAEIYLFFDYDGQSDKANDDKLKAMIEFFDDETDHGLLYVNYPMVEALRHIEHVESFKDLKVACKENIGYKNLVHYSAHRDFADIRRYNHETWQQLITLHLKKLHYIVSGEYIMPSELISQATLFACQYEQFIQPSRCVAVLSAFPVFLRDYFGISGLAEKLNTIGK
jgi:hypothetical protein